MVIRRSLVDPILEALSDTPPTAASIPSDAEVFQAEIRKRRARARKEADSYLAITTAAIVNRLRADDPPTKTIH